MAWYLGLMSGTSLDGVDGVLVDFPSTGHPLAGNITHVHLPLPAPLRAELLALNRSGSDELHRAALAANGLATLYADAVQRLLLTGRLAAAEVRAIGAHGQTVRHRPQDFGGSGYTLQLLSGALLAELTGIDVVCDFRSRDVAAGGQGAPLVPAFHAACFARPGADVAVLNLGGIANLTLLAADGGVRGFDTGPGNVLMDRWCMQHRGTAYDEDGGWAAGGRVHAALLAHLLAEAYFTLPPPKSTGRDLFDADWLAARLAGFDGVSPQDVMATLAELTAGSVVDALRQQAPRTTALHVCGGGARNLHLMARLRGLAGAGTVVTDTDAAGLPPDQVEALAFAWLARAHVERQPGNVPAVTGARGGRVLGALHPAA